MIKDNFEVKITELLRDTNVSIDEAIEKLEKIRADSEIDNVIEQKRSLVGNCYYDENAKMYYRAVSEFSPYNNRIACVGFSTEPICYFFDVERNLNNQIINGTFEWDGNCVSLFWISLEWLKSMKSISYDTFFYRAMNHVNELINLDFYKKAVEDNQ